MPFIKNVEKKIKEAKQSKVVEEKKWDIALKFLEGNQHLSYDKTLQSFLTKQNSDNPTINLLLPIYRNVVSRLVAAYPGIVVMPASPSSNDIVKAQSSEMALKYFWSEEDMPSIINEVVQWLIPCGNVLLHEYYDPDKEKVCPEVIKPFDFFYEAGIFDERESRWVAIRRFADPDDLIELYPDKKEFINTLIDSDEENFSRSSNPDKSSYYTTNYVPPGKLEIYEIYDRKGNHGIVLNDEWLFEGETPDGVWPVQHIKWTEIRNRVWGQSLLEPLIEIQSYYNRARGQILQNVEMMSNPKWLIPKGAGVAPNAITKRAGEKIFFNPAGGTPQQVSAAPIPSYVIDNIRQLQTELMDVSGIHGATLGKRVTGLVSGKAIQEMTSADLSSMQTTQNGIEKACQKLGQVVLVYMKAYYSESRMYKMFDRTGSIIFRAISSEDIVEVPDIFIQANTLFQFEATDKENRTLQLMQAGLLTPEEARNEIDFRTGNAYIIEKMQGMAHANEMLDVVKDGAAIEIFATDDTKAFQKVFEDFIKNDPEKYYGLPIERQNYIRDILVSLMVSGQPNPDAAAMEADQNMKIFPRQATKIDAVATMTSPVGQAQVVNELANYSQLKAGLNTLKEPENASPEAIAMNGGRVR